MTLPNAFFITWRHQRKGLGKKRKQKNNFFFPSLQIVLPGVSLNQTKKTQSILFITITMCPWAQLQPPTIAGVPPPMAGSPLLAVPSSSCHHHNPNPLCESPALSSACSPSPSLWSHGRTTRAGCASPPGIQSDPNPH